jgi:hypothetical protein
VASADETLSATLIEVQPLFYADGASAALDRPPHVRSGSSLHLHDDALVLVQDDANFIALVEPAGRQVTTWTLPAGPDARRQFDDVRGNKRDKLDLEAAIVLPDHRLIAFGSGSSARRETIVLLDLSAAGQDPALVHAPSFYAALRARPAFAGSELNVEGAVLLGNSIRLFNRGNGAAHKERTAVNASIDCDAPGLLRYLLNPSRAPVPELNNLRQYELGSIGGRALTFTDATMWNDVLLFTAVAELSPDATRDGPVTGSVIGVLRGNAGFWTPIRDDSGSIVPIKVEGIAADRSQPGRVLVIVDPDDPARPSDLCTVQLAGPWRDA